MLGDGSADALGCARDDGNLACEFLFVCAHMFVLSWFVFCLGIICY
jgi:hypothetical protein